MANNNPRVKILILGEGGVGKTSLLSQYIDNQFKQAHMPTIGVEYKQKIVDYLSDKPVRVQVWDAAGTERFRAITPKYYKNCDGVLLVFDITDQKSFQTINYWISELNDNTDIASIQLMLVGNKSDLENKRQISLETAKNTADQITIQYFETSAKDNEQTKTVFDTLVSKILANKGIQTLETTNGGFKLNRDTKKQKPPGSNSCCST